MYFYLNFLKKYMNNKLALQDAEGNTILSITEEANPVVNHNGRIITIEELIHLLKNSHKHPDIKTYLECSKILDEEFQPYHDKLHNTNNLVKQIYTQEQATLIGGPLNIIQQAVKTRFKQKIKEIEDKLATHS